MPTRSEQQNPLRNQLPIMRTIQKTGGGAATPTHPDFDCVLVAASGDRARQAATTSDLSRQNAVIEFLGTQSRALQRTGRIARHSLRLHRSGRILFHRYAADYVFT